MAERRMFAKRIVDSDDFLDMPLSAQALYFHLGMRADDDGFINNTRRVARLVGASADDLRLLIDGGYLTDFQNGVMVINHWKMNNFIRKDRYVMTLFVKEKQLITCDDDGTYSLTVNPDENKAESAEKNDLSTGGQPLVNQRSTQYRVGKDSIGKDSIGKGRVVKERIEKDSLDKGRGVEVRKGEVTENSLAATTTTAEKENFIEGYFSSEFSDAVADRESDDICESEAPSCDLFDYESDACASSHESNFGERKDCGSYTPCEDVNPMESSVYGDARPCDDGADKKRLKPRIISGCSSTIYLSDEQYADLLDRLGKSELERYMAKLSSFITERGARIRSHYDMILKWYEEDLRVSSAPKIHRVELSREKPRYGSFDPTEAFEYALRRTRESFEETEE